MSDPQAPPKAPKPPDENDLGKAGMLENRIDDDTVPFGVGDPPADPDKTEGKKNNGGNGKSVMLPPGMPPPDDDPSLRDYTPEELARMQKASELEAGRLQSARSSHSLPPTAFKLTDYGNAERLVRLFGKTIRFCPPRRKWLVLTPERWIWDETGEIVRLAKITIRTIQNEADQVNDDGLAKAIRTHARKSESSERIRAAIGLAETEPGIPILPKELDSDPYKLNCKNGTLDLRTGKLLVHCPDDYITKMCPVVYDETAVSEQWETFLDHCTNGDINLRGFHQRLVGYALTGLAIEKVFVFMYGRPDTGKSTFIGAIAATLGDYHESASFDTWCKQTQTGGNRGDLVRLAGTRLVTSVETSKGKVFDEGLIKQVTGGDDIIAAAKYEVDFKFRATFTLVMAANDAPKIRDDDEGAWARVLRVPFDQVVSQDKINPQLKLDLEDPVKSGPAILAWAVRGCLLWQQQRLGRCDAIVKSTNEYRKSMDRFEPFKEECLVFEEYEEISVPREAVSLAYKKWAEDAGMRYPLSGRELAERLRANGAVDGLTHGHRIWKKLRLRGDDDDAV